MGKWPDEVCSVCGKVITSRMTARVLDDAVACSDCYYKAEREVEMAQLQRELEGQPTERQIRYAKMLDIYEPEGKSFEELSHQLDEVTTARDEAQESGEIVKWMFSNYTVRIATIQKATMHARRMSIEYLKDFDDPLTTRIIEPYQIQISEQAVYLLAWQVKQIEPENREPPFWRHFRLDKMVSVTNLEDSLVSKPIIPITIAKGIVHAFNENPVIAEPVGIFWRENIGGMRCEIRAADR